MSVYNAGDLGSIPGSGRSPGKGNGNLLQYYCLENPMDRGAWKATVHGIAKSQTRLSDFTSLTNKASGGEGIPVELFQIQKDNAVKVQVAQSCQTPWDPMDCSPPGSSVHEILKARTLECVAVPFSRGSSRPRDLTRVSCSAGRLFTI